MPMTVMLQSHRRLSFEGKGWFKSANFAAPAPEYATSDA